MQLLSAQFLKSAMLLEHCPDGDRPEFAFIGRSNVGKSSLINRLCHRKTLALTSPKPGKTQLMNYFAIQSGDKETPTDRYLVDLPGYGYARVSKDKRSQFEDMIIDYLTQRPSLTYIFVLIDGSIPPQQIDLEFVSRLQSEQRPYMLVFTKTDKTTQKIVSGHIKQFTIALSTLIEGELPPYSMVSSLKVGGVGAVEKKIDELLGYNVIV